MKNIQTLIAFFIFFQTFSQKQVHIKYLNVRSPIANVYENLYTNGNDVISIQDGNIMWTDPSYKRDRKGQDVYFISKLEKDSEKRNFFFTSFLTNDGEGLYFIHDQVPKIVWKIDETETKKILGYQCKKAVTNFRGSAITAYFTSEIPYSIGPFKFYGLPGAILDVRVDGKNYNIWKAIEVETESSARVDYSPQFPDFKKSKLEDFVTLKDAENERYAKSAQIPGSTGTIVKERMGLEKRYEWEE